MSGITSEQFEAFFLSLHGYSPFPWQSMLLHRVVEQGWPDLIDLPTASGKTACMDVAVFALAMGVPTPRRIWFVVDRRIVVDEAHYRAIKIAQALADARTGIVKIVADRLRQLSGSESTPLAIGRLRGGAPRSMAWTGNPAQPAIVASTLDQIGSRLLFRGYGVSDPMKPVHAALAGNDSLIILDEAHLARPFLQTVAAVEQFRGRPWASTPLPTPFKLVVMSATPPDSIREPVRFPRDNERDRALKHPKLQQRLSATKPTQLAIAARPKPAQGQRQLGDPVCDDELVLDIAQRAMVLADNGGRRRLAIMVNRVATARLIAQQLRQAYSKDATAARIELLTGRLRPVDRDLLVEKFSKYLKSGSENEPEQPLILVTTQCLEVGADFSFDTLLCECASLDALRQRFGRLSRLGEFPGASGVILIRQANIVPKTPDPIYGSAMAATWKWLNANADVDSKVKMIPMGVEALQSKLPQDLSPYLVQPLDAPILLPAYLDLLSQTSPRPAVEPDVSLFLHGIPPADQRPRAQVRVLWREYLTRSAGAPDSWEELVTGLPPLSGEMLQVPLSELRRLLLQADASANADADVEGGFEASDRQGRRSTPSNLAQTPFVIWRGRDDCQVTDEVDRLRPDDTLVLPADSSLAAALLHEGTPSDVYEAAYRAAHGVIRRLYRNTQLEEEDEFDREAVIQAITGELAQEDRVLFRSPQMVQYARGFYHFTPKAKLEPVDRWESDADEEDRLYENDALGLEEHTHSVVTAVTHLSRILPTLADPLTQAAQLHDVGKADPRFQHVLHRRRWVAGGALKLRAKSGLPKLAWRIERRLREEAKLPKGFRHELLSMQMAKAHTPSTDDAMCPLILHLIASHHGRCRPFAPVVVDEDPPSITCPMPGKTLSITCDQIKTYPAHRLESGVAEQFWTLTRRYGWWGLAYLESILRCADIHTSIYAEQENHP